MPGRPRSRTPLKGIRQHGRNGYQAGCGCDVCRKGNSEYMAELRKRKGRVRSAPGMASVTKLKAKAATESSDSVPTIGLMEQAVIDECATLASATERPTLVVAARNLAKIVDDPRLQGMHNASTKQIMGIMNELRPKATASKRKSGGRLATVGALTKVKRAQ